MPETTAGQPADTPPTAEWIVVGPVPLPAPGEVRALEAGGLQLALYNVDGVYYATENECTHGFAFLSEGRLDGERIHCPAHDGCFSVKTGEALEAPAIDPLKTYRVRVNDGIVAVSLAACE